MWRICPLGPTPEKVHPYTLSFTDICNSPTKLVKLQKRHKTVNRLCAVLWCPAIFFSPGEYTMMCPKHSKVSFVPLTFWDGMCWG
jgi:hypothetical protein